MRLSPLLRHICNRHDEDVQIDDGGTSSQLGGKETISHNAFSCKGIKSRLTRNDRIDHGMVTVRHRPRFSGYDLLGI